jgi:hypothetical protein
MEIAFSMRAAAPPSVLIQELAGEAVLLHLEREQYFGLDDVGTRMWKAVTESASIQEGYEALLREFEADPEQLRQDLSELLTQLVEHGLLEVHPD